MPHIATLPDSVRHIHILGIAGTAMGALAGMLHDAGYTVSGSDKAVYPPMSDYLASLGIQIKLGYVAENLTPRPDLVVVGNVIRAEYEEAQALLQSDIPYMSFPELLGQVWLKSAHSIVVAGTHGKTTTTSLIAQLLDFSGLNPGFLIGGIAKNFNRTARSGTPPFFVVEGDEYDTAFFDKGPKFLHYHPKTVILTSVEFDHADIYQDLDHVKQSFHRLMALVPHDGVVIARGDDAGVADVISSSKSEVWKYGPGFSWDGRIEEIDSKSGTMQFTVLRNGSSIGTFRSMMVGEHNLFNQVAAAAAAIRAGVPTEKLGQGFESFLGIKRRQEVIGEPGQVTVIDDFAHHPTAVRVTLDALRQRFGRRRLWAIWEPRSATSRRAIFQQAYAEAFDAADKVIIAQPFNTASISEEERFSSEKLVMDITARGVDAITLPSAEVIAAAVASQAHPHDVVAILSNGSFDGLHGKVLEMLSQRFSPWSLDKR